MKLYRKRAFYGLLKAFIYKKLMIFYVRKLSNKYKVVETIGCGRNEFEVEQLLQNAKNRLIELEPNLFDFMNLTVYTLVKKKTLNLFSFFIAILVVKRKKALAFFSQATLEIYLK